jgi:hypothetical protein
MVQWELGASAFWLNTLMDARTAAQVSGKYVLTPALTLTLSPEERE